MTVFAGHSYTYRADGLKTGETGFTLNANGSSDTVTLTWNYDGLDRLTSETSSDTAGVAALNYTDTDVNVPVGTNIAIGTTSAVFGDAGGGLQVELLQFIPKGSFANPRDVSQLLSGW